MSANAGDNYRVQEISPRGSGLATTDEAEAVNQWFRIGRAAPAGMGRAAPKPIINR